MTVQVLLADDQAMVRSGFRLILESQPGITVTAEAADGIQAVALARELRPDACLVAAGFSRVMTTSDMSARKRSPSDP